MLRCPYCGEIASAEREFCASCGTKVPDHSAPFERRVRALLISVLVLGALVILSSFARDWFASRG